MVFDATLLCSGSPFSTAQCRAAVAMRVRRPKCSRGGTLRGRCLSAAYVVLFVGALISIVRARMDGGMKLVWLVFAFVAPFLGSLLWLLIGRRRLTPRQNT
ncbi:PLD nuclease N-terminal domain-containing protein [Streptomyces platensis]|uniref:PLD nuclease N-terminal domain-containing protein n=1 Tax=Streptomyces platensis TaxID=58346 RepID=UPI0030E01D72